MPPMQQATKWHVGEQQSSEDVRKGGEKMAGEEW